MSAVLTSEQQAIRQAARDFADAEIRPHVMEWDEAQRFPREVFRKLGELGFLGTIFPEAYGGAGLSYMDYIGVIEEISAVDGSVGLSLAAHTSLGTNHIFQFGTEEQRRKYVSKLATGEWLAAWGLTEAEAFADFIDRLRKVRIIPGTTGDTLADRAYPIESIPDVPAALLVAGMKERSTATLISSIFSLPSLARGT